MRELWQSPSIQNNVSGGAVSVSTRVAVVEQTTATQIYRINGPTIGKHLLGQFVADDSIKLSSILAEPESYSRPSIFPTPVADHPDGEETPLEADNTPPPENNANDDHSTSNQQNDDRNNAADDSDINNNNDNADDNNTGNNNDSGSNNQNNDPDDNDQQNTDEAGDLNDDDRAQEGDENSDNGNPEDNDKFGDHSDKFVSINTPYDSIEAQFKPVANSSFKKDPPTSPDGAKSDEFSGTESMEYIHIAEQPSPAGKEKLVHEFNKHRGFENLRRFVRRRQRARRGTRDHR
ncbi:hypothetical protein U1Q18_047060 [Sarracenia purpurea var. burkii]